MLTTPLFDSTFFSVGYEILVLLQTDKIPNDKIATNDGRFAQNNNIQRTHDKRQIGKNFFFLAVKMDTDNNLNYINRQTN